MSEDQMLCKVAALEASIEGLYTKAHAYKLALETVLEVYDYEHPLRTADFHHNDCACNRCRVDAARKTYETLK